MHICGQTRMTLTKFLLKSAGKANTTPTTTSVVKGIQQQASEKEKRVIQDDAEDASSNDQKSLPLTTALPELGTILENPNDDFDGERYLMRKSINDRS